MIGSGQVKDFPQRELLLGWVMAIGTLNEGPLHAALKATYVAHGGDAEVPVEGFVADAVRGGIMYEVQTGSFSGLGRKLKKLLDVGPLVLVHPIPATTYIVKIDAAGEVLPGRRRSPKRGALINIVGELVYIPQLLEHPNFSVEVILTEEEEWRVHDPKKRRGRGGWRTVERHLLKILDTARIGGPEDLMEFVEADLPVPFTTRDLSVALDEPLSVAQQMAYCLRHSGLTEICGKQGNALRYDFTREPFITFA